METNRPTRFLPIWWSLIQMAPSQPGYVNIVAGDVKTCYMGAIVSAVLPCFLKMAQDLPFCGHRGPLNLQEPSNMTVALLYHWPSAPLGTQPVWSMGQVLSNDP